MADSPDTDEAKGDGQSLDDSERNNKINVQQQMIEETTAEDSTISILIGKKDDNSINCDSFISIGPHNGDICGATSPSCQTEVCMNDLEMKEADVNDSELLFDNYVSSLESDTQKEKPKFNNEVVDTKCDKNLVEKLHDYIEVVDIKCGRNLTDKLHDDVEFVDVKCDKNLVDKLHDDVHINGQNVKQEGMIIDKDDILTPKTNSPLIHSCGDNLGVINSNNSGHTGSPGTKRMTTDEDNDSSPKPKRSTPDRSDNNHEMITDRWKDENETTNTTESEPTSKDLPDLSSDSDDDDDHVSTPTSNQGRPLRRRHLRRRRFGRGLLSSDESDTTDDDDDDGDTNDGVKNADDDDDKESDEEVQKAVLDILNKPIPKPNWYSVSELRKREYGYTYHQSPDTFREHVQGSLEMVKRLVLLESMEGHEGCVNALSFNRIGTLLASGSDDLNIVLWNWQRARPSLIYDSGHRSNVFQAKFMPFSGDCHVISCARDGQVRLAELSLTGVCKATRKLAQHRGAAHKLALEMDSPNVFLSCGEDAVTYLFDLRQERPHKLVTTKESDKKVPLYSIHSNPCDSRQFCVGGRDHYIRVYDKRKIAEDIDGGVLKKFCPDHLVNSEVKANVTCACYNYNGSEILGSYNDEDIYLFDNCMSDGANYVHKYTGHRNNATVKGVNFYGPKSEFIVSGSDCGHVYFWDKETEAIVNFQEGDQAGVINVLEPHPNLPVLATSGLDHDVKIWMPAPEVPDIKMDVLKRTLRKNYKERSQEKVSAEPEMIGGQMLWFIMHHFRHSARRRMREEGQVLSTSDDDSNSQSEDSDINEMQCAQS